MEIVSTDPSIVAFGSTFAVIRPDGLQETAAAFIDCAHRLTPILRSHSAFDRLAGVARGNPLGEPVEQHEAVCAFLDCLKAAGSLQSVSPEAYGFVAKCAEYDRYLDQKTL